MNEALIANIAARLSPAQRAALMQQVAPPAPAPAIPTTEPVSEPSVSAAQSENNLVDVAAILGPIEHRISAVEERAGLISAGWPAEGIAMIDARVRATGASYAEAAAQIERENPPPPPIMSSAGSSGLALIARSGNGDTDSIAEAALSRFLVDGDDDAFLRATMPLDVGSRR